MQNYAIDTYVSTEDKMYKKYKLKLSLALKIDVILQIALKWNSLQLTKMCNNDKVCEGVHGTKNSVSGLKSKER